MNRYISGVGVACALLVAQLVLVPSTAAAASTHKCLGDSVTIFGTPGSDVISGTKHGDVIFGGRGHDTISGLGGGDRICGGRGADTIYAYKRGALDPPSDWDGESALKGGRGNDKLYGSGTTSSMWPGPGDDLMNSGNLISPWGMTAFYSTTANGDGGYGDASPGPIVANLEDCSTSSSQPCSRGTVTGPDGTDTLIDMREIVGSPYVDTITTNHYSRDVEGADGNDTIIVPPDSDPEFFNAGNGDDTVISQRARGGCSDYAWTGWDGNDTFYADPAGGCFEGDQGDDTFHGNEGPDEFAGNAGDDAFLGGGGSDTALFDSWQESQGPEGPVNVNLTTGLGTGDGLDTFSSVENLVGSNVGGDTLIGNGKPNSISAQGSAGSVSVIRGKRGDDYLWGHLGADLVYGGQGSDQVFVNDGVSGNDTADGGRGTDLCRFDPNDIVRSCES